MKMVERKMTLVMDRVERLRKLSEKIPSFKDYQKSADWKDLAESLEFLMPMSGTRNILVHGYDKVEDNLIYGILKRHLNEFDAFLTEIRDNYLRKIDR